jgi:hypothetical protein
MQKYNFMHYFSETIEIEGKRKKEKEKISPAFACPKSLPESNHVTYDRASEC